MSEGGSNLDLPADKGPIGKPSQAEGEDGEAPEMTGPQEIGKPSQAEGEDGEAPEMTGPQEIGKPSQAEGDEDE